MNRTLIAIALVTTLQTALAQENLSREETLKYAFLVSLDLPQLTGTPLATDVDVTVGCAVPPPLRAVFRSAAKTCSTMRVGRSMPVKSNAWLRRWLRA